MKHSRARAVWFSPDYPAGLVLELEDCTLLRVADLSTFEGDRDALQEVRRSGVPAFPGEFFLDLVGVSEIAERANVDQGTVHAWRARHDDFPPPLAALRAGPVWAWASIERWLRLKPPVGRPHQRNGASGAQAALSPVSMHLRGDGSTATFRLRDRFEPATVDVEVNGQPTAVVEESDGRRFRLSSPPPIGAVIRLRYMSTLAGGSRQPGRDAV